MTLARLSVIIFFLKISCCTSVYGQQYNAIDKVVLKYPKEFDSTEDLAKRIQRDFDSQYEKARAIYSWIALNIRYDYQASLRAPESIRFSYRTESEKQKQIALIKERTWQKAFNSRKAVCEGFTLLYQHIASLVGLKSEVIRGDSKRLLSDIGRKNSISNHAWNTVEVDGKWILVDVTWGQGYYDTNRNGMVNRFTSVYFDTEPNYFFAKHFPDTGVYNNRRLDKSDFLNGPLIYDQTIEGDYAILRPNSGIIQAKEGEKMHFKIKNISKTTKLHCVSKKHQRIPIENPKEVNGTLEFQVTSSNKLGGFITFFVNQNSIVTFKVISN